MRSTYRILFLIRKKKLNKDGLTNIMVRISISGEKAEFSSLAFVKPEMWSPLGRVLGRTKEVQQINDSLDKIKIALDNHYKAILEKDGYVTAEKLRDTYLGKEIRKNTVLSLYDIKVEQKRNLVGKTIRDTTLAKYLATRKRVGNFMVHKYKKYYVNMVIHKEPDAVLRENFKRISQLRVDVSYPYLLPIYNDYNDGIISKDEFNEILHIVENYVFRRVICGIPTNSLNKTFENLYKSVNKEKYMESVKASFLLLDSYKRFPNDVEFENALMVKDVYNLRNRNYMFSKLENFNRKEPINISDYTIEHIIPQNPDLKEEWKQMLGNNWQDVQEKYLHTLGNLTITGYNSELSDRPFSEKKTIEGGFNDSPLKMNEYLRTVGKWDEIEIQNRAGLIADKAKDVWAAPFLPDEVLNSYTPDEAFSTIYTVDSYEYLIGDMLELYKELKKRILNLSPIVREEFKKLYIAFKAETNFVDIVPQKSRLRLSLNLPFDEVVDPKGLCRDVSGLGRWGNGDVEVGLSNTNELDDIMDLIQQAFEKQMD